MRLDTPPVTRYPVGQDHCRYCGQLWPCYQYIPPPPRVDLPGPFCSNACYRASEGTV